MAYADVLSYLRTAGFARVEAFKNFDRQPASAAEFEVFSCGK